LETTLREIADIVGGEVVGDDRLRVSGINSLEKASPGEISFFYDPRYKEMLSRTKASAVLVPTKSEVFEGPQVVVPNPALAYAKLVSFFAPAMPRFPGHSDRAFIHETSRIGENVSIFPLVYVGEESVIGDDVTLFPGVHVGDRVRIGNECVLYPNVTVMHDCILGSQVVVHAGTVIGSDGFGYVQDKGKSIKIPQLGIVQVDDRVEIGANVCIDRAALGKTWIKEGVKIDNLVQVAHNVVIGEDSIIVAQVGISGSVEIGRYVVMGGQVGIVDHVKIGDRVMIGSQSGVAKSIPAGQVVSGSPAIPHRNWLRAATLMSRLPELNRRLRDVEKKLAGLEERVK
jgi:UDP-3-O-[3-hydroxymyristoyl] glucosamine N-acyltransferase